ncbi:hypothetical protein K461DRAFT_240478 [Myriangium duriaei CBS 260.36]|uniref:RRM domain-containing protein n=1 Tax=Myriangium duriaei CBS 260.36 TaxID=1168546 RepID=A0A9P4MKG6_9PEZI|nr:hypothetical protein K461DRAFT_240478 [Myriangium duriaei CBS 260.36]
MSTSVEAASKKRKGATEPVEVKKRTKVAEPESSRPKKTSKVDKVAVTEQDAPVAKRTRAAAKSPATKPTKPAKAVKSPAAEDFAGFTDSEDEHAATTADHTDALLAGFSSDSESDSEQTAAITTIPSLPDSADFQKELAAAAVDPESVPGTIYVGRIPHGFYEPQMRAYFSQFGTISRLRLSRNKLTGKPKHYAYIEFESSSVADIVAKTMDKYLMFGHILQVRRLKPEEVHAELYKGANRRFKTMPRNKIEGSQLEKPKGRETWDKKVKKEEQKRKLKSEKLKELGYDFEMPTIKQVDSVPKKPESKKDSQAEVLESATEQKLVEDKSTVDAVVAKPSKKQNRKSAPVADKTEASTEPTEGDNVPTEKRKKGRMEKKGTKKARLST